ncbi:hypothetical protein FACS1894198_2910 [Clostridia bacterium]|nr:hypothetical protein FACS1894198_2910 [Clostridia bacterium]
MRRVRKSVFFFIAATILGSFWLSFSGIHKKWGDVLITYINGACDLRYGIDVGGGIDATLKPRPGEKPSAKDMLAVETILKQRLLDKNITDGNVYTDCSQNKVIVQVPYEKLDEDCDTETIVEKLAKKAMITFREKNEQDENGKPKGDTLSNVVITGADITEAKLSVHEKEIGVILKLSEEGAKKFREATDKLSSKNEQLSMWIDDTFDRPIGAGNVMTEGLLGIGVENIETARDLVDMMNEEPLPFGLVFENASEMEPSLGPNALETTLVTMLALLALTAILMILRYKVPGMVCVLAMIGQIALFLAVLTGFFPSLNGLALTLPVIIGIVVSLGIGMDSSIASFERIKKELADGKTIKGAVDSGLKSGKMGALVGNTLILIVATVAMGCFGPQLGVLGRIFQPMLKFFDLTAASTSGTIYSFGYIMLFGAISNMLLGVGASSLMLKSLARFKALKNPRLYGGKEDAK